ncbi:C-8 acyltransferase [Metarhizium acridum CQMa 102]|uniref:C-8 acyltransferase n=1 Tax=Metarhizium acridum (strain CQMa 102) TaxID=655827 RepID=E9EB14_METAQ|nr:C-8 acyltransferase [Metarhizium acridum CQMa 102]EFY86846.1 C-8 acyltransferase [Metarhizium acridum CQMa 102]
MPGTIDRRATIPAAKMVQNPANPRVLGTWNQVAMRAYVRQVFCFPIDEQLDDFDELCTHIKDRLRLACHHFPHFAGKICLSRTKGKVYISMTKDDKVSFKIFDNRQCEEALFGWSYPELKAQGFPCKAFVGPWFDLPYDLTEDGPGVPVTEVHARIIRGGGLLLCFYFHHSITDGIGMHSFISTVAALTRRDETAAENGIENGVGTDVKNGAEHGVKNGVGNGQANKLKYPANIDMDIPESETTALLESSFEDLMKNCPEYTLLPQPTGPTAPCTRREWVPPLGDVPKTGRIFKFSEEKIRALQAVAQNWSGSRVRTFACLAGVVWSFCTAARLAGHQPREPTTPNPTNGLGGNQGSLTDKTHLLVPASWAKCTYQGQLPGYASNAVCMPRISANMDNHVVISGGQSCTKASAATADELLGKLICSIDSQITAIDKEFVDKRTAMFRAAPDPRFVGINLDPQEPSDFIFNSWRHLGADVVFWFPGLKPGGKSSSRGETADAVRRAQSQWNMGAGLVLPGKLHSDYEILVTLDEASMMRLLANEEWKKWVSSDNTIE